MEVKRTHLCSAFTGVDPRVDKKISAVKCAYGFVFPAFGILQHLRDCDRRVQQAR